jgi:hypothetical protein
MTAHTFIEQRGPQTFVPNGFYAAKCIDGPITYPCRWHRDALVQLALDPKVISLHPIDGEPPEGAALAFGVVHRTGPVITLLFEGAPDEHDLLSSKAFAVITRAQVDREPIRSAARSLWAARGTPVPLGDRMRVLATAARGITFAEAANVVAPGDHDPFDVVAALVCEGLLAVDLAAGLTPTTRLEAVR